jgi:hypothetical protein
MRGLAVLALGIGGLPAAVFAATVLATDGAPLHSPAGQSPSGHGMPVSASLAPPPPTGGTASFAPAGIPPGSVRHALYDWAPPAAERLRTHRANAAWDRLGRLAAAGDRDALVFMTLMKSADFARPHAPFTP